MIQPPIISQKLRPKKALWLGAVIKPTQVMVISHATFYDFPFFNSKALLSGLILNLKEVKSRELSVILYLPWNQNTARGMS